MPVAVVHAVAVAEAVAVAVVVDAAIAVAVVEAVAVAVTVYTPRRGRAPGLPTALRGRLGKLVRDGVVVCHRCHRHYRGSRCRVTPAPRRCWDASTKRLISKAVLETKLKKNKTTLLYSEFYSVF